MTTVLALLLVWLVLRDWPDVVINTVDLYDWLKSYNRERAWKRKGL